jgi:hypothetical protein
LQPALNLHEPHTPLVSVASGSTARDNILALATTMTLTLCTRYLEIIQRGELRDNDRRGIS